MRLLLVTGTPFTTTCIDCGARVEAGHDRTTRADLDGKPFTAYYCADCSAKYPGAWIIQTGGGEFLHDPAGQAAAFELSLTELNQRLKNAQDLREWSSYHELRAAIFERREAANIWPVQSCSKCNLYYWACPRCGRSVWSRPANNCGCGGTFKEWHTQACCQSYAHHLGDICLHCGNDEREGKPGGPHRPSNPTIYRLCYPSPCCGKEGTHVHGNRYRCACGHTYTCN